MSNLVWLDVRSWGASALKTIFESFSQCLVPNQLKWVNDGFGPWYDPRIMLVHSYKIPESLNWAKSSQQISECGFLSIKYIYIYNLFNSII